MKKILYLGTSPAHFAGDGHLVHYPVIKIMPKGIDSQEVREALDELSAYTHLIFTSKNSVKVFFNFVDRAAIKDKFIIAIGKVTALHLEKYGKVDLVAAEETQEGIIAELQQLDLKNAYVFLPRSQRSRPELVRFLEKQGMRFRAVDLYDTVSQRLEPVPDLKTFDEIVFTSPSTVAAFKEIFGVLPRGKKLVAIGPITEEALDLFRNSIHS